MDRRSFGLALASGVLAASRPAFAQQPPQPRVVGWMMAGTSDNPELFFEVMKAFRALGYGQADLNLVALFAEGQLARLETIARELVDMKAAAIYAGGFAGTRAARRATSTIPIVFSGVSDPVGAGFVESLERPGRNITGISEFALDTPEKALELLLAALPNARTLGVLGSPNRGMDGVLEAKQRAARNRGVTLVTERPESSAAIDVAFAAFRKAGVEGLIVISDGPTFADRERVAALAIAARMPTLSSHHRHTEDGGLMSYSPAPLGIFPQVAACIDRILKGARPGDLPVQGPRDCELVLNRDAARSLGIAFPRELLLRADRIVGRE